MKISTKGRYAVNIMLDMALDKTSDYIPLKLIAERQGLSGKYLEQIVAVLNKAGYVTSVRGFQGGYKLSKPTKDYTLGMILRLMEGSLSPVKCLDNECGYCIREGFCVTVKAWKKLDDAISDVVDSITLQDMVDWQLAYDEKLGGDLTENGSNSHRLCNLG